MSALSMPKTIRAAHVTSQTESRVSSVGLGQAHVQPSDCLKPPSVLQPNIQVTLVPCIYHVAHTWPKVECPPPNDNSLPSLSHWYASLMPWSWSDIDARCHQMSAN
ncbi:hypothetical protein CsSME_00007767 [Camellia sinensis var. sinensis]